MKPEHPRADAIERFARGELEGRAVVLIALHVDECPACAALAASADPMGPAFASADDPPPPRGLAESIRAADREPRRYPPEPAIAIGLLAASALVLLVAGNPTGFLVSGAAAVRAVVVAAGTVFGHLQEVIPGGQAAAASTLASAMLAALLLAVSVAAARRTELRRTA